MLKILFPLKAIFLFVLLFSLSGCVTRKENSYKNLSIYILMGQSNMAGRGVLSHEDSIVKNKKVLMFTENFKWIPARNPIHFDKPSMVGVGPGLSFGLIMQHSNTSKTIGLVPTAVGGTSIDVWTPGAYDKNSQKHPYDDAEKRIVEAMRVGVVKGVIWHQGESDSNIESAETYLPKLILLIKRIRNLTGNPNLPFVVGELGRYKSNYDYINKQLAKLPSQVKYTAIASSEGLVDKGDIIHFDSKSADLLGLRFAAKMLELQKL